MAASAWENIRRTMTYLPFVSISIIGLLLVLLLIYMMWMPGKSARKLPTKTNQDQQRVAEVLRHHVRTLSEQIGSRSIETYGGLTEAAYYIQKQFEESGYKVRLQEYHPGGFARPVANLEVELLGTPNPDRVFVIGAHYDSIGTDCPGADDNASGVAALIVLASRLRVFRPSVSIRFVAFVNEEPPFFKSADMGSFVYAAAAKKKREKILGFLSLETIGYFTEQPKSQKYPFPFSLFYPSRGNFIGFVGNLGSARLVRKLIKQFRKHSTIPSQGLAAPSFIPGIDWSDQWSFWQHGYQGVMVTDTAPFRNPHYHHPSDTWDTLDYPNFARVVLGLEATIKGITR